MSRFGSQHSVAPGCLSSLPLSTQEPLLMVLSEIPVAVGHIVADAKELMGRNGREVNVDLAG